MYSVVIEQLVTLFHKSLVWNISYFSIFETMSLFIILEITLS